MPKMFRSDIGPSNFTFPYDISLFSETIQVVLSLLSQILGLENDKSVSEVMVGTVVGHNTHTERGGESVCGHFYPILALYQTTNYNHFLDSTNNIY